MSGSKHREISIASLGKLSEIFSADWPKHVVTLSTLQTFMKRFERIPELKKRFKIYVLSESWEIDGSFVAIFKCNDIETFVFFDTLGDNIPNSLEHFLKSFDYSSIVDFFSIRNIFRAMALNIINEMNLNTIEDTNTICYVLSKHIANNLEVSLPRNLRLAILNENNIDEINSSWPHRYDGSEKFIEYSIKYHINIGLFDENDELLAWCLRYDNGALAVLQVAEKHLRKGYGSLVTKAISKRIADEDDCDITALVVHENIKSSEMFKKIGFKPTDSVSWFVMTTKK